jgi:hypothetical protein
MANNLAAAAPEWAADFCKDYVSFLFTTGKWTLIAGILLGVLLAVAAVIAAMVAAFRKPAAPAGAVKAAAAAASPIQILEAMKAFLQALSSAPTWLALFGGGILLLWLAGAATPEICKPGGAERSGQQTERQRQTPPGNDQYPAGNQSTNAQGN